MSRDGSRSFILLTLALLPLTSAAAAAPAACAAYLKFLGSQCAAWQADVLPLELPPARGNRFADRQDAAAFGMKVFYDNRFSKPGSGVACASCHDPEHSFAEKKARSHTIAEAARNAPDLINASWYTTSHFWDGKVDNLWSAPLFTLEQTEEMGATRLQVVHTVASIYKIRYEKIFGALPDLSGIDVVGRAITPPTVAKRFDAWALTVGAESLLTLERAPDCGELEEIAWVGFDEALGLSLAPITRVFVTEAQARMEHPGRPRPFVRHRAGYMRIGTL